MKDIQGNIVKTGDILLELGRGSGGRDFKYHLKIWQKPSKNDGSGFVYDIDGIKHRYRWASVSNSVKIDMSVMPEGFEFSFKHGMSEIASKIELGTPLELIENSDWKKHEVRKEEVEHFKFMKFLKIEKVEDIVSNIEELKKSKYVPSEIVFKVLELTGFGRIPIKNGDIGIATMHDHINFYVIIETISKNRNYFKKINFK